MMSSPPSQSNPIDDLFFQITNILHQTWKETGFGELKIESERTHPKKIAVTLKGSIHYRFILKDEDVANWFQSKNSSAG